MKSRDSIENNDNQSDSSININPQLFTCRDERDVTQTNTPLRQSEPAVNPDLHTAPPSNKKDKTQH